MTPRTTLTLAILLLPLLPATGCINIGPTVWTPEHRQELTLDDPAIKLVAVQTHNGYIRHAGRTDDKTAINVTAYKKAGGRTHAEAQSAFDALEVFIEPAPDGRASVGWRWTKPRQPNWAAHVSFEIDAPATLAIDCGTHNGGVQVAGVAADCDIETHNGGISVSASGPRLEAITHNGSIRAAFSGQTISLHTHNGGIDADLAGCKAPEAEFVTHNGPVSLALAEDASARITCITTNGRIDSDIPWTVRRISRCNVEGALSAGEGRLTASTHNGSIKLRTAAKSKSG